MWKVCGPGPAGYLVTDRARWPAPVAFVPGVGARVLARARVIRQDHGAAARDDVRDLRRCRCNRLPRVIVDRVLLPVDARGRVIGNARTFGGGMYIPQPGPRRPFAFIALTHHALAEMQPRLGTRSPNAKRGSPVRPFAPSPASSEGKEAGSLTAA